MFSQNAGGDDKKKDGGMFSQNAGGDDKKKEGGGLFNAGGDKKEETKKELTAEEKITKSKKN